MNKKPFMAEKIGIAYMLAGDTGASNIDPYAEKRTSDNQWIAEGAHIMVLPRTADGPEPGRTLCHVEGHAVCAHHGAGR
jgi:hypothetical protein